MPSYRLASSVAVKRLANSIKNQDCQPGQDAMVGAPLGQQSHLQTVSCVIINDAWR
jgi:hypothetical protein